MKVDQSWVFLTCLECGARKKTVDDEDDRRSTSSSRAGWTSSGQLRSATLGRRGLSSGPSPGSGSGSGPGSGTGAVNRYRSPSIGRTPGRAGGANRKYNSLLNLSGELKLAAATRSGVAQHGWWDLGGLFHTSMSFVYWGRNRLRARWWHASLHLYVRSKLLRVWLWSARCAGGHLCCSSRLWNRATCGLRVAWHKPGGLVWLLNDLQGAQEFHPHFSLQYCTDHGLQT
jgi:hypothetical protein